MTPLITRKLDAHKGDHGALGIVGGARGTVGAGILSARMAVMSGCGRVYLVRPDLCDGLVLDPLTPEVMLIDVPQSRHRPINTWLIGPGLGESNAAHQIVADLIRDDRPMVIDADGLNLIAQDPALARQVARRDAPTIMTPHPAEAARLLQSSVDAVQSNRVQTATELASRYRAITLLKGAESVIASEMHPPRINHTGNAALATGGTGDVLAGLIGALVAQGISPMDAVIHGTEIHGLAAEQLTKRLGGMIGITASELIPEIRQLINR
ncbi:MAG: hypothetical protein RJA58_768 [Pseudomonadota bacterium]